jgi:hypothetical protein
MVFVGIDFGVKGGIAVIDEASNILDKWPMPVTKDNDIDTYALSIILKSIHADYTEVYIAGEKLHAIFGSAAKATFKFGHDYGVVKTMVSLLLKQEAQLVRAVDWQKRVFAKLKIEPVKKPNSKRNDTKIMALHSILNIWPNEDFRKNSRCRIFHDGMIDACLIAWDLKESTLPGLNLKESTLTGKGENN